MHAKIATENKCKAGNLWSFITMYLLGANDSTLSGDRYAAWKTVREKLDADDQAKTLRTLCRIRMNIIKSCGTSEMVFNGGKGLDINAMASAEDRDFLLKIHFDPWVTGGTLAQYLKTLNLHIDHASEAVFDWYPKTFANMVKTLFVSNENDIIKDIETYKIHIPQFPFGLFLCVNKGIDWTLLHGIFFSDRNFVNCLYYLFEPKNRVAAMSATDYFYRTQRLSPIFGAFDRIVNTYIAIGVMKDSTSDMSDVSGVVAKNEAQESAAQDESKYGMKIGIIDNGSGKSRLHDLAQAGSELPAIASDSVLRPITPKNVESAIVTKPGQEFACENKTMEQFLKTSKKTAILVDCENTDAFSFYIFCKRLSEKARKNVSLKLYDTKSVSVVWTILVKEFETLFASVELLQFDRVMDYKSQVDFRMTLGACDAIYKEKSKGLVIVSSDSDFWSLYEHYKDVVSFAVIYAEKAVNHDYLKQLVREGIPVCNLNEIAVAPGETDHISDLQTRVVTANVIRLMNKCMHFDMVEAIGASCNKNGIESLIKTDSEMIADVLTHISLGVENRRLVYILDEAESK